MNALYNQDFVAWTEQTTRLLKEHRWDEIDLAALIEEVEDLGGRYKDAIESQLTRLLMHLLKWQYQRTGWRGEASWRSSINEARKQIRRLQKRHPSLKRYTQEIFETCYPDAVEDASDQTGIPEKDFPGTCPLTLEQVLDSSYLPPRPCD